MTIMDNTTMQSTTKASELGRQLRKAREGMQLSEKEAAARLHLNPKYITAMENEDFENGLPATFIRGHLRSYARLLNFPEQEIHLAIEKLGIPIPNQLPSTPLLRAQPIKRSERYIRWITYLVLLILIALVVMWWTSHSRYTISNLTNKESLPVLSDVVPNLTTPVEQSLLSANFQPPIEPSLPEPKTTSIEIKSPTVKAPSAIASPTLAQPEISAQNNQLSHIKMQTPEPALDTSDDGRDADTADDNNYAN